MKEVRVTTQAELEATIKAGNIAVCVEGDFMLTVRGTDAPQIILQAKASLYVEAWESSQPRVVAWESSQPSVEARGYVQLSVVGKVVGKVAKTVSVLIQGAAKIEGGRKTTVSIATPREWCAYYGVSVSRGVAIVFKGVDNNYRSPRGADYTPGTMPVAKDWDGGKEECGGGLHFSPTPKMALEFFAEATKFVACPVALKDMRATTDNDSYQNKIKAKGCCGETYEVNEDGEAL